MADSRKDLDRIGEWICSQLLALPAVEERKSRFGAKEALCFEGTEFFHLDEPGLADIRLGRRDIRASAEDLRSDPRVELRPNASDWFWFRFASRKDAHEVVRWAKKAMGKELR